MAEDATEQIPDEQAKSINEIVHERSNLNSTMVLKTDIGTMSQSDDELQQAATINDLLFSGQTHMNPVLVPNVKSDDDSICTVFNLKAESNFKYGSEVLKTGDNINKFNEEGSNIQNIESDYVDEIKSDTKEKVSDAAAVGVKHAGFKSSLEAIKSDTKSIEYNGNECRTQTEFSIEETKSGLVLVKTEIDLIESATEKNKSSIVETKSESDGSKSGIDDGEPSSNGIVYDTVDTKTEMASKAHDKSEIEIKETSNSTVSESKSKFITESISKVIELEPKQHVVKIDEKIHSSLASSESVISTDCNAEKLICIVPTTVIDNVNSKRSATPTFHLDNKNDQSVTMIANAAPNSNELTQEKMSNLDNESETSQSNAQNYVQRNETKISNKISGDKIQVEQKDDKISIYKALALKLKKDLAKSKEALQISDKEKQELESKLELSLKENLKLTNRYSQQVRNFNSLQAEYDKVLDEFEVSKKKYKLATQNRPDDEIKDLKLQCKQRDAKIFELESKLSDALLQVEQKDQLKEKIRQMNNSYRELEAKHSETMKEKDRLAAEITQHQAKIESLQNRCRELSSEIKKLDSNLFCERHNFEIVKSSFEAKVKNLKEQLATSEEESQNLMNQFDEYRSKAGLIIQQSSLGRQTNHSRTFEAEKMRKLEQQNQQYQDKIILLERKLQTTDKAKNDLELKIQLLLQDQQTNQDRLNRLSLLESDCERLKKENINLNRALEDLSRKPNAVSDQISADYEAKISSMRDEYEQKIKKIQESLKELQINQNQKRSGVGVDGDDNETDVDTLSNRSTSGNDNTIDHRFARDHDETLSVRSNQSEQNGQSIFGNHLSKLWSLGEAVGVSRTSHGAESSSASLSEEQVTCLTQQLHEAHHTNALLSDQVSALKDEIRRLQLGAERLEIAEKLEYLKNIIVKFVTLEGKAERQRLIPVLATMLKLSPEEQARFDAAAGINEKPRYFGL